MKVRKLCATAAIAVMLFGNGALLNAQVTIGADKTPEVFSLLELVSNESDGLRLPQMTTEERDAMADADFKANPEAMGLQIFNTTTHCVNTWSGFAWIEECGAEQHTEECTGPSAEPDEIIGLTSVDVNTITSVVYKTDSVDGYSHYIWTVPDGWTIQGASDGISITAVPGASAASGYVTVEAYCTCGTSAVRSLYVEITSTPGCTPPAQPSVITGSTFLSPGATETYSVVNEPDVTYEWILPSGWTGSSTTNSITVTAESDVDYGDTQREIKVIPHRASDCSGEAQTLTVHLAKCGAYVAPGDFREFMCWNLGADQSLNPFIPAAGLNGDYYQWGYKYPSATYDVVNGDIKLGTPDAPDVDIHTSSVWSTTIDANAYYGTGTDKEVSTVKSTTDPCPDGFRVPNQDEWTGVINSSLNAQTYNPASGWVVWTSSNNFWSGVMFGDALFLPAAGNYNTGFTLGTRGTNGHYWSSTSWNAGQGYHMNFYNTGIPGAKMNSDNKYYGKSVRCIRDENAVTPACTTVPSKPEKISGIQVVSDQTQYTYSIDPVPEATSYIWTVPLGWQISGGSLGNNIETTSTSLTVTAKIDLTKDGTVIQVIAKNACGESEPCVLGVSPCGANGGSGMRAFMCYNLGATLNGDPYTPAQEINGDYYQWGAATPVATSYNYLEVISDYPGTPLTWYGDNTTSTSQTTKSPTDPCPAGYRVPNLNEWLDVVGNVRTNSSSTWTANGWAGAKFGSSLFLPTAGTISLVNGTTSTYQMYGLGLQGTYWTTTLASVTTYARTGFFIFSSANPNMSLLASGCSVRCIAE